ARPPASKDPPTVGPLGSPPYHRSTSISPIVRGSTSPNTGSISFQPRSQSSRVRGFFCIHPAVPRNLPNASPRLLRGYLRSIATDSATLPPARQVAPGGAHSA